MLMESTSDIRTEMMAALLGSADHKLSNSVVHRESAAAMLQTGPSIRGTSDTEQGLQRGLYGEQIIWP